MNKVVNYLVAAAVSLTSVSAMAVNTCGNLSGVYAGGNFGYGMGSGKLSASGTPAAFNDLVGHSVDLGVKGLRGGVHFGYGKLFPSKVYLGIEASADFSNTTGKFDTPIADFQVKRRDAYGLALRLGGVLGAGMLTYTKVGVETAKWKSKLGVDGHNESQTKRATGLVLGLGMETMVSEHVMVGGEWAYTAYNRAFNISDSGQRNGAPATFNANYKPRTNDFRLRASYKW